MMQSEPSVTDRILIEQYIKNTTKEIIPKIYAYTTQDIPKLKEYIKIGYTERDNVDERIEEQTCQFPIDLECKWWNFAYYKLTKGDEIEWFRDSDFHTYLAYKKIERFSFRRRNEWFKLSSEKSQELFNEFRLNHGFLDKHNVSSYTLRVEQEKAIEKTIEYWENGCRSFLWNAKPRFGKTLTAYEFCKRINAKRILIVTNRPTIANSWWDDYEKHIGSVDGYYYVNSNSNGKKDAFVRKRKDYDKLYKKNPENTKLIQFVSLQYLKGSKYFGGSQDKCKDIKDTDWDVLIVDETHEGVDTNKTSFALSNLSYKFSLHLSGTPYKQLASDKFGDAVYNWTYLDEQTAKKKWGDSLDNPYAGFPKLNLFTYKMSDIVFEKANNGFVTSDGEDIEYAFDLNEFFSVDKNLKFIHEGAVNKFLKALITQKKFPFSTPELRNELKHTFWILDRVRSAKALKNKLETDEEFAGVHNIFKDEYKIILAPDEPINESGSAKVKKTLDDIRREIETNEKTITLSVRKLTVGITIKEWTAVLMLNNGESPAQYMQTAFRTQTPCNFSNGGKQSVLRKENVYIFDFNPARTLTLFENFATKLSQNQTANTDDEKIDNIKNLLNFFPVIGEDENGEMIKIDAYDVLAIPRKLQSSAVFQSGFKNSFLFGDMLNSILSTSNDAVEIINKLNPYHTKDKLNITESTREILHKKGIVIGLNHDLFGHKQYSEDNLQSKNATNNHKQTNGVLSDSEEKKLDKLKNTLKERVYGFSRLIPLFLMAYGKENVTKIENFETFIPKNVFEETTSITVEEFKYLRDTCKLFNSVIFNSAAKEFFENKRKLANYLENDLEKCIFDYIPSWKTNVIFTPRNTVVRMVDYLEKENPDCFSNPDNTFIDIYMKSGIYIAEIVKRLYNNQNIKKIYPNADVRLQHIFEKQVYGFAPSQLLYDISIEYLLGDKKGAFKHNFKAIDVTPYVKENKLQELIDKSFNI